MPDMLLAVQRLQRDGCCERLGTARSPYSGQLRARRLLRSHGSGRGRAELSAVDRQGDREVARRVHQCYDKCFDNARRGVWQFSDCDVSAPQGGTAGCLNAARAKYAAYIDQECHPAGALPDCPDPDNYPDGDTWIGLADNWIFNDIPAEFCGS